MPDPSLAKIQYDQPWLIEALSLLARYPQVSSHAGLDPLTIGPGLHIEDVHSYHLRSILDRPRSISLKAPFLCPKTSAAAAATLEQFLESRNVGGRIIACSQDND